MDAPKTTQATSPWIANALVALTAFLLVLSAGMGVVLYKLATRSIRLEDLTATQRQHLIQRASEIVPPVYQPFPLAGRPLFYHMHPHTHYTNVLHASFTTNDLGFRTVPTSPKPHGQKRIVLVGDSWTFGQAVRYEETFGYQLEKLLNRHGDAWQVYNLSMPGWNTDNQIAALRTFFSRLRPDVVVFCPTSNDIDDSYDVWNGRLIIDGFASGAGFRHSYEYERRWIKAFQDLQREIDFLEHGGVYSLVYFLAEWRKLAPYYAKLASFQAPYIVVPSEFIEGKYRLAAEIDAGRHPTPEGHEMIAAYLHNALVEQQLVTGLEPIPIEHVVHYPGHISNEAEAWAELERGGKYLTRPELMPVREGFMGAKGLFSVASTPEARTVNVRLGLIDDPGLYPLTVEIGLASAEQAPVVQVFDRFVDDPHVIKINKPKSLDHYQFVEVYLTADRVVVPREALVPVSMKRPTIAIH